MTPREFSNTSRGYSEKLEQQYRAEWERARWIASVNIAPHTKKRLKPTDLIRFPWETKRLGPKHVWTRGEVIDAHNQRFGKS
jgi:hypothetical protein